MPRVKIDYIVSFSSEDPDHPASNLLQAEVGNKKWLCAKGEQECSVVLQLVKAVKISAVELGLHHTALAEVLVGRSEAPHEPYQTLMARCVVMSPGESRRGERVCRVRAAAGAALAAACDQRWDRLRVLCLQPYARHAQCGLSFVHIFEPEEEAAGAGAGAAGTGAGAARLLALRTPLSIAEEEEEDESFKPGSLFAAAAEIRRASQQALSAAADTVRLGRAPSDKLRARATRDSSPAPPPAAPRPAEQPPARPQQASTSPPPATPAAPARRCTAARLSSSEDESSSVLRGVHFVLSGYENPRRARVRALAAALGATPHRDWGPRCTHLICAFPNTPKLRAASRASPALVAVRAEWVEACARARRRLPPHAYYTTGAVAAPRDSSPARRRARPLTPSPPPSPPPAPPVPTDQESDYGGTTDEEDTAAAAAAGGVRALAAPLRHVGVAAAAHGGAATARRYARAYGAHDVQDEEGEERRAAWLWAAHNKHRAH